MEYVIEKNVPIPTLGRKSGLGAALMQMEIGDCLLIPVKQNTLGSYIQNASKSGKKFTTRKVEGGTRVWRIA